MTYLAADDALEYGRWYHVAGVYDGDVISLYVNGQLARQSTAQSGDILYPQRGFYEIGAYHDEHENFRLKGAIHEVCVYRRALSREDVAARYAILQGQLPQPEQRRYARGSRHPDFQRGCASFGEHMEDSRASRMDDAGGRSNGTGREGTKWTRSCGSNKAGRAI